MKYDTHYPILNQETTKVYSDFYHFFDLVENHANFKENYGSLYYKKYEEDKLRKY